MVELKHSDMKPKMQAKGIRMRPHHYVLILVCIATYLLVFESVLSLPRAHKQEEAKHDAHVIVPWGQS
jgi:hypothetical protein